MKKTLMIAMLSIFGSKAYCQNGALTINNHMKCDMEMAMIADDYFVAPGGLVSNVFTVPPGTMSFSDPCAFESGIGWFGISACTLTPPMSYSAAFTWQNVRMAFYGDCSACSSGSKWSGRGSFYPPGYNPAFIGYPVWTDRCRTVTWSSSGVAPEDVTIDIY